MCKKLFLSIIILGCSINNYSWSEQANLVLIKNESNQTVLIRSTAAKFQNRTTDNQGATYDHWGNEFSVAPGATLKCSHFIIPWNSSGESIFIKIAGKTYDIHEVSVWRYNGSVGHHAALRYIEALEGSSKIAQFDITCSKDVCMKRHTEYMNNTLNVAIVITENSIEIKESQN